MLQRTNAAILCPGQGSALADCRPLVEHHAGRLLATAVQLLEVDPLEHAAESTRFAQPAIFLASLSGWRAAAQAGADAYAFAGHSLGEITALTAACVFTPEDALQLVVLRARLMDECVKSEPPGGMLAILKGTAQQAERLALQNGLYVANYNAPGQTVLSGPLDALQAATREARSQGLRALQLSVNGPFHSPALAAAHEPFLAALKAVPRNPASAPVISCLTTAAFTEPATELADALTAPVRWSETMLALQQLGTPAYLDVGPDHVLERLAPRIIEDAQLVDRESLLAFA